MKVHHLNCGSLCPSRKSRLFKAIPSEIVCHCLLIETNNRLILVDTGLGKQDLENPKKLGLMSNLLNVQVHGSMTAFEQVKKLGYSTDDVTDLILTHLDLDHAGGIPDFKKATVHVSDQELATAKSGKSFRMRERYRSHHMSGDVKWQTFTWGSGEHWQGFDGVRSIKGLPEDILIVPLPGHTPGHTGVAVHTNQGWLLHAGDAYYDEKDVIRDQSGPLWTKVFERLVHTNYSTAIKTKKALMDLKDKAEVSLFSSHDPKELRRFS